MATQKKNAVAQVEKSTEQAHLTSEKLREIFAKADASLDSFLDLKKLSEIQNNSGDQFQKNFLTYIKKELDLLKILNLLINAPYGLNKGVIGQYVMADKYKGKVASAEEEKKKIMKNLNYIEKNIAHLSALLYMFFPKHRNALGIVRDEEKTKGKAFRYRFNDFETARRIFSDLVRFDNELTVTYTITEKTRNEIAETCIEDVAKELSGDSFEDKEHYQKLLSNISKAISNHTLCEVETVRQHSEHILFESDYYPDCEYFDQSEQRTFYFLPFMIRDVSENSFDINLLSRSKDMLYKYLHMKPEYIVQGLRFEKNYKGELTEAEWFRNAYDYRIRLSCLKNLKLKDKLSESKLKFSETYNCYKGELYKLNPYRNLCGEDFYLLLPSDFLTRLPSAIKRTCISFVNENGRPDVAAESWIKECSSFLNDDADDLDLMKFNFSFFDKDKKYSLVKCTNYLELLHQLNLYHVSLPDSTLPRELVDRQSLLFTRSMLNKSMIASPHHNLFRQKVIKSNLLSDVIPADKVFNWSQSTYENARVRAYLSKFNFRDYGMLLDAPMSSNVFCRTICLISYLKDEGSAYEIGIPLCCREKDGSNYLIFWDYSDLVKQISLKNTAGEEKYDIEKLEHFILSTQLDEKKLGDTSINLKYFPLLALGYIIDLEQYESSCKSPHSNGDKGCVLSDKAQAILVDYADKVCRANPKLDDVTHIKRTYHVFFERAAIDENMFIPDCFDKVTVYLSTDGFESNNKLSAKAHTLIMQLDKEKEFRIMSFETHKRSEVIRFLHENMGRVFYLDVSDNYDDPLGIKAELEYDCHHVAWPST